MFILVTIPVRIVSTKIWSEYNVPTHAENIETNKWVIRWMPFWKETTHNQSYYSNCKNEVRGHTTYIEPETQIKTNSVWHIADCETDSE